MNNVVNKQDTLAKLLKGVNTLADVVKTTSGSKGHTILIEYDKINATDQKIEKIPYITKDGVTVAKHIKCDDRVENMGCQLLQQAANLTVEMAGDGPQPLYAKVLTPNGFVNMGDLIVGQVICGTNGTHQTIEGIFPKGKKEIYEVYFRDGRMVECCEDHLWKVTNENANQVVKSTKQLLKNGLIRKKPNGHIKRKFYMPKTFAEFKPQVLPIPPYLLGLLLGDGSLSGTGNIELSLGKNKEHILDKIPAEFKFTSTWVESKNYFRVVFDSSIVNSVKELGLYGVTSSTKFIPKNYLYSSVEQRRQLLTGLIDTDGHINVRGLFEYSTISKDLKNDFLELCRGLGLSTHDKLYTKRGVGAYSNTPIYRITELEGYKHGEPIVKIVPTGKLTEMQCIKVSNEDHLYLTDNYIVTHNTTGTIVMAQRLIQNIIALDLPDHRKLFEDIEKVTQEVQKKLYKTKRKVKNLKDCIRVATISTNNAELGKLVGQVMWDAKDNGVVMFELSPNAETYVYQESGSRYDRMYDLKQFLGHTNTKVSYHNPLVVVLPEEVVNIEIIKPYLDRAKEEDRATVIFAPDYSKLILNILEFNAIKNGYKILPLYIPGYGEEKMEYMKDIMALVANDNVDKIVATKRDFTLFTKEMTSNLQNRIDVLAHQITTEESPYYREKVEKRMSILSQKVFTIYAGATSEIERNELKDRMEDGLLATRAALEDGYVIGGGMALYNIAQTLPIEYYGNQVMYDVLCAPANQIAQNAMAELVPQSNPNFGFNTTTMLYEDFYKVGIIDPYKVISCSLDNAVSVTKTIISLNGAITNGSQNI